MTGFNQEFDVLIVGAGPAGSFAAERLARAGARVALFDGRPAGEAKACGGGVTSKALKAWPFLLEAGGRAVTEVEMVSPAGDGVRLKLAEPFAVYSRCAFDSYLLGRAQRAGAEVFECRVSVSTEKDADGGWVARARGGGSWWGRVLAASDGANSAIARRLAGPLPNSDMEVAFGYRTPLNEADDAPTVIAFLPGWAGYAWAFPRLDHISFGIATAQDAFDHKTLDRMLWDLDLLRVALGGTLRRGLPRGRRRFLRREVAGRLRPRAAPRVEDETQVLRRLLGRSLHGQDDQARARAPGNPPHAARAGHGRSGLPRPQAHARAPRPQPLLS
ncbi:MAG: FAD-dependent monooxygenase [Acidobacteria bacterium]|nr:FAD-dependent monooxygenase [Acidobacteriota bacterium]MCA1619809.1 FAD-dependent monooxygenase [Acidobacteriota bacterium]